MGVEKKDTRIKNEKNFVINTTEFYMPLKRV